MNDRPDEMNRLGERLQKVIAASGLASRRAAEKLIIAGRVTVNGELVQTLGARVQSHDRIQVDGKNIPTFRACTIALHKPVGYITTRHEPGGRATIYDLLPKWAFGLHPIGRLDRDSSGLILLTNQGDLTLQLTHPRSQVSKVYHVYVKGYPSPKTYALLKDGIVLADGPTLPTQIQRLRQGEAGDYIEIALTEGRKRQVRRMFAAVGHPVQKLQRVAIGTLRLGTLAEGHWRELTKPELNGLALATPRRGRKEAEDHES